MTTPPSAAPAKAGMSDDEMRVAIAEACGTHGQWYCSHCRQTVDGIKVTNSERHDPRAGGCGSYVQHDSPDYPNDLNAMHEAELMCLNDESLAKQYVQRLYILAVTWLGASHCTARQRATAFLKTIGKWKE